MASGTGAKQNASGTRNTGGFLEKVRLSAGPPLVKSFYQEATGKPGPDGEIKGTLTSSGVIFGIISTILGGGIVGLPFSFYSCGIYLAIFVAIIASF